MNEPSPSHLPNSCTPYFWSPLVLKCIFYSCNKDAIYLTMLYDHVRGKAQQMMRILITELFLVNYPSPQDAFFRQHIYHHQ